MDAGPRKSTSLIPEHLKKAFALIFLVVLNVIQAGYDVLTSNALQTSTVHPTVFIFLRCVGATFVLWALAWWKEHRRPAHDRKLMIELSDSGTLITIGALALAGQLNCVAIALSVVPPSLVGMMAPLVPALALPISLAVGLEIFSRRKLSSWLKVLGAAVMLGGGATIAAIAASSPDSDLRKESKNLPLGIGFVFAAKSCGACYPILQKLVLGKYRSHTVALWMYIAGSVALGFCVVPLATNPEYWAFDVKTGLALLYAIVAASAINYSLIAFCNKRLSPVILTASYPLEAIVAPVFAYVFLGQKIGLSDALGGGVIVVGLFIFVYAKWRQYHDDHEDELLLIQEEEEAQAAAAMAAGEAEDEAAMLALAASADGSGGGVVELDANGNVIPASASQVELTLGGRVAGKAGRGLSASSGAGGGHEPDVHTVTDEGQLMLGVSSVTEKTSLLDVPQSPRMLRPSTFITPTTPKLGGMGMGGGMGLSTSIAIGGGSASSAVKRKARAPSIFLDANLHDDDVLPTGLMAGLENPSLPGSMKRGAASFLMRANNAGVGVGAPLPFPSLASINARQGRANSGGAGLANEAFLAGGATPKLTSGPGARASVKLVSTGAVPIGSASRAIPQHHQGRPSAVGGLGAALAGANTGAGAAALIPDWDGPSMAAMVTASSLPERAPGASLMMQRGAPTSTSNTNNAISNSRARVGSDNAQTSLMSAQHNTGQY